MRVITVRTRGGEVLGSCTARCYNATPEDHRCVCICRGENHSKGETWALAHAHELGETWRGVATVELDDRADQLTLAGVLDG